MGGESNKKRKTGGKESILVRCFGRVEAGFISWNSGEKENIEKGKNKKQQITNVLHRASYIFNANIKHECSFKILTIQLNMISS